MKQAYICKECGETIYPFESHTKDECLDRQCATTIAQKIKTHRSKMERLAKKKGLPAPPWLEDEGSKDATD